MKRNILYRHHLHGQQPLVADPALLFALLMDPPLPPNLPPVGDVSIVLILWIQ